jgi:hypothetical protein
MRPTETTLEKAKQITINNILSITNSRGQLG